MLCTVVKNRAAHLQEALLHEYLDEHKELDVTEEEKVEKAVEKVEQEKAKAKKEAATKAKAPEEPPAKATPGWRAKSLEKIDSLKKELKEVKEVHSIKDRHDKSIYDHMRK